MAGDTWGPPPPRVVIVPRSSGLPLFATSQIQCDYDLYVSPGLDWSYPDCTKIRERILERCIGWTPSITVKSTLIADWILDGRLLDWIHGRCQLSELFLAA